MNRLPPLPPAPGHRHGPIDGVGFVCLVLHPWTTCLGCEGVPDAAGHGPECSTRTRFREAFVEGVIVRYTHEAGTPRDLRGMWRIEPLLSPAGWAALGDGLWWVASVAYPHADGSPRWESRTYTKPESPSGGLTPPGAPPA